MNRLGTDASMRGSSSGWHTRHPKGSSLLSLCLVILLSLGLFGCGQPGTNRDSDASGPTRLASPVKLRMGTGSTTGTYYPYGEALAKVLMDDIEGLDIEVLCTEGAQSNLYDIAANTLDLAFVQNDVADYATRGSSLFLEVVDGFSAMAALYPEACQIVARPDINTVVDLKGRNVSIGEIGSGSSFNAIQILDAYDMSVMSIKVYNLGFEESVDAFRAGTIDAFFCVAGIPTVAISELAASDDITLLSVDEAHAAKLIEKHPFYNMIEVKGGTYRGVDSEVPTVAVKAMIIVSNKLSSDLVYMLTKALFENRAEIASNHVMGAYLDEADAIKGITVPFHPGAERYFHEIGLM